MKYKNETIQKAVEEGNKFIVLEPQDVFDSAVKEFHQELKRLVYDVEELLECLSSAYDWDAVQSLEWFDYNVYDLTFLEGGPIFYDKFEEKYLTVDE